MSVTPQIDNTIKELIKELGQLSHLSEIICEKVNEQYSTDFTSNQIRQYLKNELQIKLPQNRAAPFTPEIDDSIKKYMKEFGQLSNPYVKIKENINKQYSRNYTSKQIRQRWISKLYTNLCLLPLGKDEKSFIVQWVESKPKGDTISWKELIPLMETKFKKLRSENMVKNFWNLRKRTQGSTKSKAGNENSRKRSPKLKAKNEKQRKKVCHELTIFEYENEKYIKSSPPNGDSNKVCHEFEYKNEEYIKSSPLNGDSNARPMDTSLKSEENIIHLPPLNARPVETSFKSEVRIHSPPLNARPMKTLFESEERTHLSPLNASPMKNSFKNEEKSHFPPLNVRPMETSFKSEERIQLPPLNARSMELSFKSEERNHSPPLNARPMKTSFESEVRIYFPPLNVRPMETSFKSEERIHLPPLNVRPMETPFKSEERIHLPPLNVRPFKNEEKNHLPPLKARSMEISFENEENTPPSNRMEILCCVAAEVYKRDFPTEQH